MDFEEKCISILCAVVLLTLIAIIGVQEKEHKKYQQWYQTLTVEEQQAIYESNIERYEVVGVHKYAKTNTNQFGGVISTDIYYSFTYLKGDTLCSNDDFYPSGYGEYISIGDKDLYIVNHNGETSYTLQLTRETLENMKGLN